MSDRIFAGIWLLLCIAGLFIAWQIQSEYSYEPVETLSYSGYNNTRGQQPLPVELFHTRMCRSCYRSADLLKSVSLLDG